MRLRPGVLPTPRPYWDAKGIAERTAADPFDGDLDAAADELDRLLTRSVERRMVADVPLGAFLSGGIDSSTVTALMQKVANRPVMTFTVGFGDARYDESDQARTVARHLGTAHTEIRAEADAPLAAVEKLPQIYDEPFADKSQLPTVLLAALTRQHVTTALSGDGGDELFGGYDRYSADRWLDAYRMVPAPIRDLAGRALERMPDQFTFKSVTHKLRWVDLMARKTGGEVELRVHPVLIPARHPIAGVDGVMNAVLVVGDAVGPTIYYGAGAGAEPTASAVVADIMDMARGYRASPYGVGVTRLSQEPVVPIEKRHGAYYLRLMVLDRPGVIADVAAAMRDHEISVEGLLQRGRSPGDAVPIIITTHETDEAAMRKALAIIEGLEAVLEPPRMIRIEAL